MKKHKTVVAVFLVLVVLLFQFFAGSAKASETDSQDKRIYQIAGALKLSIFHEKGKDHLLIKCFDVSENGCYALGYNNNTIHVYDSLGEFQFGYRFDTYGYDGISFKENNVVIYFGKSNVAVEMEPTGKCVGVEEIISSKDYYDVLTRTSKHIGDAHYDLERDVGIFPGYFPRLVKTDETGTRTVLYDATIRGYFAGVSHYILLGLFPLGLIISIINQIKKEDQENEG